MKNKMDRYKEVRKGFTFNKIAIGIIRILIGWIIRIIAGFSYKPYKPKSDTWLLLANHTMKRKRHPIYISSCILILDEAKYLYQIHLQYPMSYQLKTNNL